MSGGYTSLPTSHFPGSVPAVVDSDLKPPKSGEANLQTFPPPSNGQSRLSGYQSVHNVDVSPMLNINHQRIEERKPTKHQERPNLQLYAPKGGEGSTQPPNGWKGFFSIAYYRPYFNVDTFDVVERTIGSLYPHHGDFVQKITHNPDMYGPVWISTTLVFMATVLGNYSAYLSFEPSSTKTEWVYDINYVSLAAAIFYAYTCFVPLGFFFLLKYLGIPSSIVQIWCLYGYSLFIFIPASFLLIFPIEILKWIVIVLSGFVSAFFVAHNMQSHIKTHSDNWTIPVFSSLILQLCLALVMKFCFFA